MNNHFDPRSLELFIGELEGVGFVRVEKAALFPTWRGRIHPAFDGLTDAKSMDVGIRDGWPFISPVLFVQGLATNHLTQDGYVCMWRDEDGSREWETLSGFYKRMEEWCSQAQKGWVGDAGLQEDAYLNFYPRSFYERSNLPRVATFDWEALGISSNISRGKSYGVIDVKTGRVDIKPNAGLEQGNQIDVLWVRVKTLKDHPPRSLSEVERHLTETQRRWLRRENPRKEFVLMFCWERDGVLSVLPILIRAKNGGIEGSVMVPGPNDEQNLILRAGPNAAILQKRKATLFGAGALGGYVAAILAQSGLGSLSIVDGDVLLPGNIARHIAGRQSVGRGKAMAVQDVVKEHAPWTKATVYQGAPSDPQGIRQRIRNSDIAIDATGNGAFTNSLGFIAHKMEKPVVSGALYRGGAVARVRRHALPSDEPIYLREESHRYPVIPEGSGEEEFSSPETGCSAPVNNAPPASVAACASLIAQVAIDALTKRFEYEDEVVDVYFRLDDLGERPFNRIGRISASGE